MPGFQRRLGDLDLAGWMLVLASSSSIVFVAAFVGPWALETIDRVLLRQRWLLLLLAIPALLAGVITWWLGSRLLTSVGLSAWRARARTDA